jgi:hypothetical protein
MAELHRAQTGPWPARDFCQKNTILVHCEPNIKPSSLILALLAAQTQFGNTTSTRRDGNCEQTKHLSTVGPSSIQPFPIYPRSLAVAIERLCLQIQGPKQTGIQGNDSSGSCRSLSYHIVCPRGLIYEH